MLASSLRNVASLVHVGSSSNARLSSAAQLLSATPLPLPIYVRYTMSFQDNLRRSLDHSEQLPRQLHLGKYAYSWTSGKLEVKGEQAGFRELSEDELRQLMRRLQAAPQHLVIFLNLGYHRMVEEKFREMASTIAALKALQVLILECTPTSPLPSPFSPQNRVFEL